MSARALSTVLEIIVLAVEETGSAGIPGGYLYAALMPYGCSYSMFETLMQTLIREGKLVKRGQLYFAVKAKVVP